MCAECEEEHNEFYGKEHKDSIGVSSEQETKRTVNCSTHPEYILDTFCHDCDCVCCTKCIDDGGEHSGHDTRTLDESKDELKAILEDCISSLERKGTSKIVSKGVEKSLKEVEDNVTKAKEAVVQNFAKLREALDKKEKEIIEDLERESRTKEIRENLGNVQKFAKETPTTLKKLKDILKDWDSRDDIAEIGREANAAKTMVESMEETTMKLSTFAKCRTIVDTKSFLSSIRRETDGVKGIQKVVTKKILNAVPVLKKDENASSSLFVHLRWVVEDEDEDEDNVFDEYVLSMREEGKEKEWQNCHKDPIHDDHFVVYPLKPKTGYEFRIMGRKNAMESMWSKTFYVKTDERIVLPEVDKALRELKESISSPILCSESLKFINEMAKKDGKQNKLLHNDYYYCHLLL